MGKANLEEWDVESDVFWNSTGKKVATGNLWISIPSLLCGFAVWNTDRTRYPPVPMHG